MDTRFELINRCSTYEELLHDLESILSNEDLFFGHGTRNAMDESMAIIMFLSESADTLQEGELKTATHEDLLEKAKEIIRKYVDFLDIDRPLYPDHTNMKALVKSGEILEEIEKLVGSLE